MRLFVHKYPPCLLSSTLYTTDCPGATLSQQTYLFLNCSTDTLLDENYDDYDDTVFDLMSRYEW